jgi:glutathionylspermidine synthase
MSEILTLEKQVGELQQMCLEAGQHIIDRNRFTDLGLSDLVGRAIAKAWNDEPPAIYGRFDLAYTGEGHPKLLEYNADTPTALLEAAVVQWYWLQDLHKTNDQWNSIHERLVAKWRQLRDHCAGDLCFTHVDDPSFEDAMTVAYLRETAEQGGFRCKTFHIAQLGWDVDNECFVAPDGQRVQSIFKLYPWEWLVDEEFAAPLFQTLEEGSVQWIEPVWKMMWSNKGMLPILWELFPNHPLLLPAYFDEPREMLDYVKKPKLSREGANIAVVRDGRTIARTDGDYGADGYICQRFISTEVSGHFPVVGAWIIDGEAAGCGIRESDTPITDNQSRFVPHLIDG